MSMQFKNVCTFVLIPFVLSEIRFLSQLVFLPLQNAQAIISLPKIIIYHYSLQQSPAAVIAAAPHPLPLPVVLARRPCFRLRSSLLPSLSPIAFALTVVPACRCCPSQSPSLSPVTVAVTAPVTVALCPLPVAIAFALLVAVALGVAHHRRPCPSPVALAFASLVAVALAVARHSCPVTVTVACRPCFFLAPHCRPHFCLIFSYETI